MSKIFRSRWSALLWAGGVIWTAYDVAEASAPPHHPAAAETGAQSPDAAGAADLNRLAAIVDAN